MKKQKHFCVFAFVLAHNNIMIYLISLICGFINGLFAAAAGQVMIFYLVFILKKDAHISRGTSVCAISIITTISLIGYFKFVDFDVTQVTIVAMSGLLFGLIGSKVMAKIKSNILNLISGAILLGISVYKLFIG